MSCLARWLFRRPSIRNASRTSVGPARLRMEGLEDRVVPSRPLPFPVIFAGSGAGSPAVMRAFDAETGELTFERLAFEPTFTGGVNVAAADLTGDGYPDAVLSPGTGGGPRVRVLDGKTGEQVRGPVGNFLAYDPAFVGGVSVAAADVSGDGTPEIITAAGAGGGPHVKVFNGRTGKVLDSFFALDPDFRGGITVAAADFTGDGKADVIVGAGAGGGPRVRVLDLTTGRAIPGPLGDFFAAGSDRRSGVSIGTDALAGDVNADGTPDLVTGSGTGEASRVVVYSGRDGSVLSDFSPFGPEMTAGVRVATAYVTDDATADVVVGTGPGVESRVRVFDGATGQLIDGPVADFTPFGAGNLAGVSLAASNDPPPGVVVTTSPDGFEVWTLESTATYPSYPIETSVKLTTKVTLGSAEYPDRYKWEYFLHNNDVDVNLDPVQGLGLFIVPSGVFPPLSIVIDHGNDVGWELATWAIFGDDTSYQWVLTTSDGSQIMPGGDGHFWFTTPALPILPFWAGAWDMGVVSMASLETLVPDDPPKVVITVVDPATGQQVPVGADGLKVAEWHDAFKPTADGKGVEIKEPGAGSNWDFIDRDRDRFNVWVYDPGKWSKIENGQPVHKHIEVKISTTNVEGFTAYNDDPTSVSLVRYTGAAKGQGAAGEGWFWSDSQMLVSNEVDDKESKAAYLGTDEAGPGGFGLEKNGYTGENTWKVSDRTHRVALRGTVKAEYTFAPGAVVRDDAPVKVKKNVKVHATILNLTAGGAAVIGLEAANQAIHKGNEQYAQVGILLIPTFQRVDPPAGVDLSNGLDGYPLTLDKDGKIGVTPEEAALLVPDLRTEATDDVEVYFINRFEPSDRWGEAFPASLVPEARFEDSVILEATVNPFTIPHELGHVLMDTVPPNVHYSGPLKYANLMYAPTNAADSVTATKRLTLGQQTDIIGGDPDVGPPTPPKRPNLLTDP